MFFTIVAWNYISYAAALMESVAASHPDSERYVVVCDVPSADPGIALDAAVLFAADVGIPDVLSMAFAYSVMEFSTAVKPYTFMYLLDRHPRAGVVYLDPDILVSRPLQHVFDALADGAEIVVTPHMTRPLQDGRQPDDLAIMKSGIYNLGFLGARRDTESLLFLRWWADRCHRDAIVDLADHKFTDQRWVDLVPAFVGATRILRHPGYNIAYWNIAGRRITKEKGAYFSNGEPVHFIHFSGVVPSDPSILSKHQDRFAASDRPEFAALVRGYIDLLNAHGWARTSRVPYGFRCFSGGRRIHEAMRLSFRRHETAERLSGAAAFASGGELFDQPEPSLAASGPPAVTRVMHELWHRRLDLQGAFRIADAAGRQAFLDWFVHGGGREAGFDDQSVTAATATARSRPARRSVEPWPPQRREIIAASKQELESWLASRVPLRIVGLNVGVYIPRMLALLWECRKDLSAHFTMQDEASMEAFLQWCLTRGIEEDSVAIGLLGPALGAFLSGDGGQEQEPPAAPQTRLLHLMSGAYDGPFANFVGHGPGDVRGGHALTLWLCGTMRERYGWPLELLNASVRWLREPSGISVDGVDLPNAIHACYRLRQDVQAAYDVRDRQGFFQVIAWYIVWGSAEFRLSPDLLPEAFLEWLLSPWHERGHPDTQIIDLLILLGRSEALSAFQVRTADGEAALREWIRKEAGTEPALGSWLRHLGIMPEAGHSPARTPSVCLTGFWGAATGRGEDIRLTARALSLRGIEFVVFDRRAGAFLDAHGAPADVRPDEILVNIVHLNAETALWDYVSLWKAGLGRAYTVGYWAWELENIPEDWNFAYSVCDEIWASTRFAKRAFESRGKRPVLLMPMAVDRPDGKLAPSPERFGLSGSSFIFYYGFDFRSYARRKNPEAAIEAFLLAFGGTRDDVTLLIKTLGADAADPAYLEIAELCARDRRIILTDREYRRADLAALVASCGCFVSSHRSEGFGRGPAEAMLLGLPVIATNWSGNTDFTRPDTAFVVDYELIGVGEGEYPGGKGQVWADVSVPGLAAAMRQVFSDADLRGRIADAGRRFMEENYSVGRVSANYAARLRDLLDGFRAEDGEAADGAGLPTAIALASSDKVTVVP